MSGIDPRAAVSPSAKLGNCVQVGAFAVVGDEVELGDGCVVEAHAVVKGPATFGRKNHFCSFSIVGGDPQDLTYTGQRVRLEAGDENEFREFCTVHRGTVKGGGVTRVGSHNLIMAYAHIGHDCQIGDHVILTNGAQLAGHSVVEDYAGISAFCLFHQFVRIGSHAYIGAGTIITQDVPPFSLIVGERETRCFGINKVGLERHGFSPERVRAIEKAYRYLLRSKLNTSQAVEKMRGTLADSEDVQALIRFIESTSARGLTK
ncbi:MAG TPA: acyl-ACP--UDP-N-acetylglucosamine O-acyltransferase [Candidatus Acidoferrales bacterium]|jgi:UDP-N-acetylglucosamine acyltransferase|nr:acyl-ACP--UDP-N-acetylglucosamine O-acyltransferase [Candidatus Acidoferrales bacterium]